jgi:hypothetical protein
MCLMYLNIKFEREFRSQKLSNLYVNRWTYTSFSVFSKYSETFRYTKLKKAFTYLRSEIQSSRYRVMDVKRKPLAYVFLDTITHRVKCMNLFYFITLYITVAFTFYIYIAYCMFTFCLVHQIVVANKLCRLWNKILIKVVHS